MKVYLVQNVANLGKIGEIKEVKSSFAYNFLLPKNLAVLPNDPRATKIIEERKAKKQQEMETTNLQQTLAQDIDGRKFIILAKADKNGHLYGSIGPKELAKETGLKESLFKTHFKEIGVYNLDLQIGDEIIKILIEIKNVS